MISAKAIESIEKNPTLKARVVNALKEGGTTALEVAMTIPLSNPLWHCSKGSWTQNDGQWCWSIKIHGLRCFEAYSIYPHFSSRV